MKRCFLVNFKTESDHLAFLSWVSAWESDNNVSTEAKIRFVRVDELFCRWTLHCSDGHFVQLYNSVGAFNATAFGESIGAGCTAKQVASAKRAAVKLAAK